MSLTILTAYDERPDDTGDLVYRAGGTDLQERLRTTGATPHVLDLTGIPGFASVVPVSPSPPWRGTWPATTRRSP